MLASRDHWFAKFSRLQSRKRTELLWSDRSDMPNQIHYRVSLLSLAKQRNGPSFIQIYHIFFKSALTSDGQQLSLLYKHFLNIIVVYAVGMYKIKWTTQGEFISYILVLLKIRQRLLQQLTSKWIEDYLKSKSHLLSRIFPLAINKQLWGQINHIIEEALASIPLQNCGYFYQYQNQVLPTLYMELIESDKGTAGEFIKQYIKSNFRKLQQVVKVFPQRKAINYQQFISRQEKYFQIKDLSKQRHDKLQVDEFYLLALPGARTLHHLIHHDNTHNQKDLPQKIKLFVTIVKEAEVYKSKTGLYYSCIDTDIIINEAQNQCLLTIQKPLLFELGLSNPQPKTVQMQMCEPTPEGFIYRPLFLSPEQVLKRWSFEKHLFVSEGGDEGQQIEADQERSHVFRLLLIGHQILSGQNMLNNGVYLQPTAQQKSVQELAKQVQAKIKSDGFKIEDYLPGIELKRELKSLQFDFSLKKLLELLQIVTDEYSLVKAVRFERLQKIQHLRILLIKRAVFLLSHQTYFKRLFNTKKYVIIFFLACAQYMHLLFLLIIAEEYRPGGAAQLRHAIRQLIVTIIRPAKKDNYMQMGYKKIFQEYKGRQDNQQIYIKKIQAILKKMADLYRAVERLKKLDEQIVKLEVKSQMVATQQCKTMLAQKRAKIRQIIMQNYDMCVSTLSEFNHNEFFKHRYQLERYHKKNTESKGQINSDASRRLLLESLNIKLYLTIKVFLKVSSYNFADIESCVLPLLFSKAAKEEESLHVKRRREIQTIDEESMPSKELRIGLQRLNAANEVLQAFKDYKIFQQFETPIDKYARRAENNPLNHYSPYEIQSLQSHIPISSSPLKYITQPQDIEYQSDFGNYIGDEQDDLFWDNVNFLCCQY